ncbi:MAG TPA: NAD(P)-binding domain-containing protein [Ktedonobacteraceae bacterium]|nr:NAD(P)-binding domain-containing protein [Ktedonobacteraceae bacterium]
MATQKLTIAVLGAGNIGGTIGRKWVNAGHEVIFGVNDIHGKNAQSLRDELGDRAKIGTIADALGNNPNVVFMAIPGTAMESTIAQYASQLDGRIIIDSANRMGTSTMNSFASLQQHTPNARIYRAFNTYGFENFANPEFDGIQADLFYCGTEGDSRAIVEQLISAIGLRPVYLGGVGQVGIVDGIAGIWFALALGQKRGRHLAFKVLER